MIFNLNVLFIEVYHEAVRLCKNVRIRGYYFYTHCHETHELLPIAIVHDRFLTKKSELLSIQTTGFHVTAK